MVSFSIFFLLNFILALLAMAFYTLMERKFLGYYQLRKGPNKVSIMGIPQPFADAMKLFTKEQMNLITANKMSYYFAPILSLTLALMMWVLFPHSNTALFLSYGALYFLCVSSMNVYTTFLAGWCSNSKYALLGALRGIAQTISYEVSMALIFIAALALHKSMDFNYMYLNTKSWLMILISPMFMMWFITNLAETNRTPFDFAEGESELVSGFNVEYMGASFAFIFMAEYMNILFMSLITAAIFSGNLNFNIFLITVTMLFATLFIWIRASLPRMRYDNLMYLTWKLFLPLSLAALMLIVPVASII